MLKDLVVLLNWRKIAIHRSSVLELQWTRMLRLVKAHGLLLKKPPKVNRGELGFRDKESRPEFVAQSLQAAPPQIFGAKLITTVRERT